MNFGVVSDITEQSFGSTFHCFPNPANESISIVLGGNESALVELFDATGRLLISQKTAALSGKIEMNISEFSNGIYTLRVTESNRSSSQIFIKQ